MTGLIILSCSNIIKNYGVESILNNINFQIHHDDRIGVVGSNGAGKSTLFKIIAGIEQADSGVINAPGDMEIGYLAQHPVFDGEQAVWDCLLENFSLLTEMEARIEYLENSISTSEGALLSKLIHEYGNLTEEFAAGGGYEYKSLIRGALKGLGIEERHFFMPIGTLSGGQQARVALARLLLTKHNLLLLDEPTNYLDIKALEWLEAYLAGYDGAVVIISHDRYFIDKICSKIWEISNSGLSEYRGSYSDYIVQKESMLSLQMKNYRDRQREINRQQEIIRRLRSFNREKSVRRANSREKMLSRLQPLQKPEEDTERVALRLDPLVKSGRDVLSLEDVSMGFPGNHLFSGASLKVYRGDIIGLIGPNGIGKTTLFNIISGKIAPVSGNVRIGHNVNIEYYHQQQENINLYNTVLDEVWAQNPGLDNTRIRNILAAFLFKGDDVFRTIESLSGGEKSRVALVKLMLSEANLLLLDEPTSHLDVQSREALENALIDYTGTILAVSHDRYFLDRVTTKTAELTPCGINLYHGNYSYYRMKKQQEEALQSIDEDSGPTKTALKQQRKREREERELRRQKTKRMQEIEQAIMDAEGEIARLEHSMCQPEVYSDPEKSRSLHIRTIELKNMLERLYEDWENSVES